MGVDRHAGGANKDDAFALDQCEGGSTVWPGGMNMRTAGVALGVVGIVLGFGCAPKQVTERDRLEAAHAMSEAQFALSVREWTRAEELLARAVQLAPQGDYWVTLGATRVRLNDREGAKDAYESALDAYKAEAERPNAHSDPWMKQAYVLALLGRHDDSRALIAKAAKQFPNEAKLGALTDPDEFARMISSEKFKEMAL